MLFSLFKCRRAGLCAAAVAALSMAACSRPAPVPEPLRAVKLITVGAQALHSHVDYAAVVRAQTESLLGFQVAGKLLQRHVQVGDVVRQGQLLAAIDGQDYALAAQAAQAQVAAATTQRDLAQADWQRFAALQAQGFISAVELDRRRASLQSAQAQLEQAQAQAAAQRNQSSYSQLLAPAAGVVTAVQAQPGQVVAAGSPVLQLAHAGPRDVVLALPEDAHSSVALGQAVQVQLWSRTDWWPAQVRELAASADPVTRTYAVKVQLQVPLAQQPPLGATAQVRVQPSEAVPARITLPTTALRQQGGQTWVWVWQPQTSVVQARAVQLDGVQGNDVVIAAGLQPGEQVVMAGTHVLTEGQKVTVYQPRQGSGAAVNGS